MLFINKLRFQVTDLQFKSHDLILGQVQFSLDLINVFLCCNLPFKGAYLRSLTKLSLKSVDLLPVKVLFLSRFSQCLLDGQSFLLFIKKLIFDVESIGSVTATAPLTTAIPLIVCHVHCSVVSKMARDFHVIRDWASMSGLTALC